MAIEQQVLQQAVDRLWKAEHTRTPCDPVRDIIRETDVLNADAMRCT